MGKSYLIEGYRFIIAISIMIYHILRVWEIETNFRLGVEFFFILSGFLLMAHIEKHPEESVSHLVWKKISNFYPYIIVSFIATSIVVAWVTRQNIGVLMFNHIHELLFLTNILKGVKDVAWLNGSGQLWFITAQLWATLILSWYIKKHRETYESIGMILIAIGGYITIIRCKGYLNIGTYWKIGENEIFLPLLLFRAIAGLACGTMAYMGYSKMKKYDFTDLAKRSGTILSVLCMLIGVCLSARNREQLINTYSWRAIIVIVLYMTAILLAFIFAKDYPKTKWMKKVFEMCGRSSMPIYVTHTLVIYLIRHTVGMPEFSWQSIALVCTGTVVASAVCELCVRLIRNGWHGITTALIKKCIISTEQ